MKTRPFFLATILLTSLSFTLSSCRPKAHRVTGSPNDIEDILLKKKILEPTLIPSFAVNISDIQNPTSSQHQKIFKGRGPQQSPQDKVRVFIEQAVVVSPTFTSRKAQGTKSQINGLFISEVLEAAAPYSGILLKYYPDELKMNLKEGDLISLTGDYSEFYNNSEIFAVSYQRIGNAPLPRPHLVANLSFISSEIRKKSNKKNEYNYGQDAEAYEGVLIEVQNVSVVKIGHRKKSFVLEDNVQVEHALIDSSIELPETGKHFERVAGPFYHSFGHYKILPRSAADLLPLNEPIHNN